MKKTFALIFALCVVLTACAQRKVSAGSAENIVLNDSTSNVVSSASPEEKPEETKTRIPFNDIKNSESFISYLKQDFSDLTFEIRDKVTDYYDDYFSMDVQESSYIAAMNENGFEVLSIGTVFNENKIIDCSISVNINKEDSFDIYKERIEDLAINTCINNGLSENEMVQTIENLFNFDTYYNNIYNNKENYARFGSNLFTGVIFEGGKDFQFDGTSYFFVFSSIS